MAKDLQSPPTINRRVWLAGTAASLLFVNYDNLFSNLLPAGGFFNRGLIGAMHGADVSGLVSIAVAAAVYWAGHRVRPT